MASEDEEISAVGYDDWKETETRPPSDGVDKTRCGVSGRCAPLGRVSDAVLGEIAGIFEKAFNKITP